MQVVIEKAQAKSAPAWPGILAGKLYPAGHPYAATLTDQRDARNFFIFNRFIAEPTAAQGICSRTVSTTRPGGRQTLKTREGRSTINEAGCADQKHIHDMLTAINGDHYVCSYIGRTCEAYP